MSYRKTRLIQQRNILLENKFISEQTSTGVTTTTTTKAMVTTTTTTLSNKEKQDIKNLPYCSTIDSKFDPKPSTIEGDLQVFQLNGKNVCTKKR
jgi:hypothetical protein